MSKKGKNFPDKSFYYFLVLLLMLVLSSCDNSGPSNFISLKTVQVSPDRIIQGNTTSLALSWQIDFSSPSGKYHLSIYLSRDETIDEEDLLLSSDNYSCTQCSISLEEDFDSFIPGKFFIIFKASLDSGQVDTSKTEFTLQAPYKKWSILIYMDGDNSLNLEVNSDLEEISSVGSDENINILVLLDTLIRPTNLYYIEYEDKERLAKFGERNMADPQTIIDFFNWVEDVFPAEHYMLILWDHGLGFKKPSLRDLLEDDHPSPISFMDIPSLRRALDNITASLNAPLDIIGFDACLMDMLEIAYEIKNTGLYMVASENWEPGEGWPYSSFLSWLKENYYASAKELAQEIVESYGLYYSSQPPVTLAGINLSLISNLKTSLDNLTQQMIDLIEDNTTAQDLFTTNIYNEVQRFDDGEEIGISPDDDSYVDLYNFTDLIKTYFPFLSSYTQEVQNGLQNLIIANVAIGQIVSQAHGLSIWFPDPKIYSTEEWDYYWSHYSELKFSQESLWSKFLTQLWNLD